MNEFELTDCWREANTNIKTFTWFKTNPTKAARLDFFLISPSVINIYARSYNKFKCRSDHSKIGLILYLDKSERGKGVWKLNSDLLNDPRLISEITIEICLMVEVHSCTPNNPKYIKNNFQNNNIELMVPIDIFWQVLSSDIRWKLLAHSARKRE